MVYYLYYENEKLVPNKEARREFAEGTDKNVLAGKVLFACFPKSSTKPEIDEYSRKVLKDILHIFVLRYHHRADYIAIEVVKRCSAVASNSGVEPVESGNYKTT